VTLGEIPRKSQPVDYLEPKPEDECGVFGLWAPGEDVAKLTYFGLYALQHRGQEAAGIAASDGEKIMVYKDLGLVSQVFDETSLSALRGHIAVGHVRYSTTGSTTWENAQPMLGPVAEHTVALAHNGNLTNTRELMEYVREASGQDISGELGRGSTTDTAVMAALLSLTAKQHPELDLEEVAMLMLPQLKGAFSVTFMTEDTLYAARDPHGVRPLVLGRLERGWVVASETAALDIVGASYVREVEPGEQPVVQSRYSIVIATAKRARQLIAGEVAEVPDYKKKPLSVAIEELHKGKVKIVSEDETENIEDTQAKQEQEEE